MSSKSALGRGLSSLIPQKQTLTEQIIPEARHEIREISVEEIRKNPHQPRHYFSKKDLEDLISSIKEHGIIQPLIAHRTDGEYELIAGERRLRAATTLGLKTVPVIVREVNEQQKLELALIENLQRQDLNGFEEALAFRALIDEFNLTQDQVAERVGKARPTVTNTLRLLELPDYILEALKTGQISKTHCRSLLAETDEEKQRKLFKQILKGELPSNETAKRVTGLEKHKKHSSKKDPNILAHERNLREILGTKVEIQEKSGRGKITISFFSKEEFNNLLDLISG